jgi:dephospho-CoA kinase
MLPLEMRMLNIALTGNAASGKSAVAGFWAGAGVPVVSADELARQAVEPGSGGLNAVRELFGPDVITTDGTLDRAALGAVIFADESKRERLEAIVHPIIWTLRDEWLAERRVEGHPLVVSEIPLLFETGAEGDFDQIVFVDAAQVERRRRLIEDRGMSEDGAVRMMAAQRDPGPKRDRSDHVIMNDGTLADLEASANRVLKDLREIAGGGTIRMDLHLHTAGSWDCLSDPEKVLERALAQGLDRIAITDHNKLHVALRMAEAYPDRIVPGEEVKTAEGVDVIGLYLTEEIPKGTPAVETIERIRAQGGVPYLPHPFAGGKGGGGRLAEDLAPLCDVVEVFNARLHSERPQRLADELAERHGKLKGAGSDAHTIGELGTTFVEVPGHPNTPAGLLAALRQAQVTGKSSSHLVHLASTWAKVRKKLPGAPTG